MSEKRPVDWMDWVWCNLVYAYRVITGRWPSPEERREIEKRDREYEAMAKKLGL